MHSASKLIFKQQFSQTKDMTNVSRCNGQTGPVDVSGPGVVTEPTTLSMVGYRLGRARRSVETETVQKARLGYVAVPAGCVQCNHGSIFGIEEDITRCPPRPRRAHGPV